MSYKIYPAWHMMCLYTQQQPVLIHLLKTANMRRGDEMKKQMSLIGSILLGVAVATVGLSGQAQALTIGICAPDLPGNCTYSVTLAGNQLVMGLTNTSPVVNGGFITAVAFNLVGPIAIIGVLSTDLDFHLTPPPASLGGAINTVPDGTREFVMSITNDYLGGGSPIPGIGVGGSATFTFTLEPGSGVTEQNVFDSSLVRFRGFLDGNSDKDKIVRSVPEPASLLLLGAGLAGIGIWRRRSTKI